MKTTQHILKAFVYLFCILSVQTGFTQNVGISSSNGFVPDASAGLDVSYANKGLLMPRVALTATNAAAPITSPAISLLVYNTATAGTSPNNVTPGYYYWNGTAWNMLTTTAQTSNLAWATIGNTGTTAGTNFIGTIDSTDFVIKTKNLERARVTSTGNFAIGSTAFTAKKPEKLLVDGGTTSSTNLISGKGTINNFLQLNIQNLSAGTNASTDVVATANNGTDTTNYIDMGINSSGNTAQYFGTANDAYIYNAGGAATGGNFYIGTSTSGKSLGFITGGSIASNVRMFINGSGNVGMGTTAPTQKLDVNGSIRASTSVISQGSVFADAATSNTGVVAPGLVLGGTGSGEGISSKRTTGNNQNGLDFYTSFANRMSITNAGNVGIGTTVPAYLLTVAGIVAPSVDNTYSLGGGTGNRWTYLYATNGTIQTSDRRLKTNIKKLNYGLKEVIAMQPVSYNWKDKSQPGNKIGLIAQDVKKIVPEVVTGDEAKEKLGMNYAELVPVLINAIKEQQKQIDDLKKAVQKFQK